jgi:Type VI secretion system/phage-baseplate injector OB domain
VNEYFGKYRGKVENNVDPEQRGRVMVSVPAVTGSGTLNWALPAALYAGSSVGVWGIPPRGANVWVEYENGDPEQPIWSGCFWDRGQAPASPAVAEVVVVKTKTCTLTLSDLPGPLGGMNLETAAGMKITLGATAIEITNGAASIKLEGPKVTINNGALEVT